MKFMIPLLMAVLPAASLAQSQSGGAYGVPRAFLMHSYSLVGLLRKTSQQPRRAESLNYGVDAARA